MAHESQASPLLAPNLPSFSAGLSSPLNHPPSLFCFSDSWQTKAHPLLIALCGSCIPRTNLKLLTLEPERPLHLVPACLCVSRARLYQTA